MVVSTATLLPPPQFGAFRGGKAGGEAAAMPAASAQVKRVQLQKQAAGSPSIVIEASARGVESGELVVRASLTYCGYF